MIKHLFIQCISGAQKGPFSACVRFLCKCLSFLYKLAISVRNALYDKRYLPSYYPPVPLVISIGNIVCGGTGKTPLTLLLTKALEDAGIAPDKIAILSRGYGSLAEKEKKSVLLSKGEGPLYDADFCGDEAYLLSKNLPHCLFLVGRDRKQSAKEAIHLGAEVLILEDGFQHRSIERHFNLVVMDASNLFGYGSLLPRGLLREPPISLKRADFIILNHVSSQDAYDQARATIARYTQVPTMGVKPRVVGIYNQQEEVEDLSHSVKVGLFCGIGSPIHFRSLLETEGFSIMGELLSNNHRLPSQALLDKFSDRMKEKGCEALLCTEKDWVKLKNVSCSLPIYWIKIDLALLYGMKNWTALLSRMQRQLSV